MASPTIRQMRYFDALAEVLHFGKAARRLNISQPALSAQIQQMEAFFGSPLLERRASGVMLTAEGRAVAQRVRHILADISDLEALAARSDEVLGGRLKIGFIASVAPYLLPALLPELRTRHARLKIEIRESITATLVDALDGGELDCIVLALPFRRPGIEVIDLFDDPFHLAVPEREADAFPSPVRLDLIDKERLILLEEGHCLRDQALQICGIIEPGRLAALGATSLATILRMVAEGLGVTLVPEIAVAAERLSGGIAIRPIAAPVPSRRLALAFRSTSGRRQDYEALAETIRRVAEVDREKQEQPAFR
ncbi:hydrogen peroxide-inducible genes activator [Consotaella salsifontis]|uniref:LysR family transcriptional regulator, hydrogen peroxide-inducible genes activator n=1 Tax=Consotaella salsifontis TaxID=1365950 RepID=A0A1T4STB7_9HYPH|nr:hydrogen peroxide-inducible genes activator [Consotaella salsifontis]SKA31495.1 LysR family transcriptional regulator, hydrogen peroxide-inducible genes activator [Consotaella salsifontis]